MTHHGDPDRLWNRFMAHVQTCEVCVNTDHPPCPIGHDLGEQWFQADQWLAKVEGAPLELPHHDGDTELFV